MSDPKEQPTTSPATSQQQFVKHRCLHRESTSLRMARLLINQWGNSETQSGAKRKHLLWNASTIAAVIWPHREFKTNQGAGAAASRVLKSLGAEIKTRHSNYGSSTGWDISCV